MNREPMMALNRQDDAEPDADSGRILSAPAVGAFGEAPPVGTRLSPGDILGTIRILGALREVVVPPGGGGIVARVFPTGRRAPVQYGEPLIAVALSAAGETFASEVAAGADSTSDDVPEGMVAVRSPTDGIFYRRPTPSDPPYVDVGTEVARGTVLGLVEVMKAFNTIAYGADPTAPETAVVREVAAEDAVEVRSGQLLFLMEP